MSGEDQPGPDPDFSVSVERADGRTVVAARGELDLATVGELHATLREHLAQGPVVLDLEALEFMDSSGVRVLDALANEVELEGWSFVIRAALRPNVRQVLELTGVIGTLPIATASAEEA